MVSGHENWLPICVKYGFYVFHMQVLQVMNDMRVGK